MIKILPLKDNIKLSELYSKAKVPFVSSSAAVVATERDEMLGYCLFFTDTDSMTVTAVEPQSDILLADGILRSALHVGIENGLDKAYFSGEAPVGLFEKLKFIKNAENRELDMGKLFSSCQNCGNT